MTGCKEETSKNSIAIKKEPIIKDYGFTFNDFNHEKREIKEGDSFGKIIEPFGLNAAQVHEITEIVKDTFDVRDLRIGKEYTLLKNKKNPKKLDVFVYEPNETSYWVVDFRDSLSTYVKQRPVTIKRRVVAAAIDGSVSSTLVRAGVSEGLAPQLSKIYAWSIDFFKIKKGDQFAIIIKEKYIDGKKYAGVASIDAAFFEYKGKRIYAFPFQQNKTGKISYYDEEGKVLKNMFLKSPLKFANITSRFSRSRFHPVQLRWKAHNGTDYAAPQGTPIMTTASGIVEKTGYTAGNGNFVKVKHSGKYSTQYLHMSRILARRGQHVQQGQIIGRVGSTGLATGPHVCYRFWKNGVQVDPLRQKLPNSVPLEKKYRAQFLDQIKPLKTELDAIADKTFNKE